MRSFIVGLVVGLLGVAGYAAYQQHLLRKDPCLGRCGDGTSCDEGICLALKEAPVAKKKRKRRRRRPRKRGAVPSGLRKPTASQMRSSQGGKSLGAVDYVDLAGETGGAAKELSKSTVTAKVRRLDPEIIGCIQRASRGYDLGGRKVKVVVGFRIERSGRIMKVQLKAPKLLLKGGLLRCVRPLLKNLTFPESSRALIMRYPYALD